jgi:hypothetical protein
VDKVANPSTINFDKLRFFLKNNAGFAGFLRFQDPAAAFLANVNIQLAMFCNQAH